MQPKVEDFSIAAKRLIIKRSGEGKEMALKEIKGGTNDEGQFFRVNSSYIMNIFL